MEIKKETMWQEIGKRLKALRLQLKYTKKKMAQRLGINLNSYYRNENGNSFPWIYTLYRLHKDFGVSMDWLIFNYGPMYLKEKEPEKPCEEKPEKEFIVKAEQDQKEVNKPWWEESMPDAGELLEYMAQDPIFRYKVFLYFFQYKDKKENGEENQQAEELNIEAATTDSH